MKIDLTTHGGWAGRFTAPKIIDTDTLPDEAAREGKRLALAVENAPASASSSTASRGMAPDAQRYSIGIDHGDRAVTVTTSDVDDDPARCALLEWIHRHLPS